MTTEHPSQDMASVAIEADEARTPDPADHAAPEPTIVGAKPRSGVWWRYVLVLVALVWALFPIVYIVSAALNPAGTLSSSSPIPQDFSGRNFTDLFRSEQFPYWTWFRNSLIVAGVGTVLQVFIGACAAYAFSRLRFAGRRPGLMTLLLAQMFPAMLAFPAILLMFYRIGDVMPGIGHNTLAGIILAYMGGAVGGNIWLLKGYFDTVPKELDEAAKMDGASHARIFFTMTLRLVAPILVTVAILAFVGLWGEFMLASILLLDQDVTTLGVGLWRLNTADQNKYFGMFCAGALIASLPVVAVYLSMQKQLVGGLTTGSVK